MVLNSLVLVKVAYISADLCQYIASNPERLSSNQVLHLLFVYPFQQLGRLSLFLWTVFCFPPPDPYLYHHSSTSPSSSSSSSSDLDFFNHIHAHIE